MSDSESEAGEYTTRTCHMGYESVGEIIGGVKQFVTGYQELWGEMYGDTVEALKDERRVDVRSEEESSLTDEDFITVLRHLDGEDVIDDLPWKNMTVGQVFMEVEADGEKYPGFLNISVNPENPDGQLLAHFNVSNPELSRNEKNTVEGRLRRAFQEYPTEVKDVI